MLNKTKNKPVWYQVWTTTVAFAALYYLFKYLFFELSSFDRLLSVYALVSLLVDYIVFPKNKV